MGTSPQAMESVSASAYCGRRCGDGFVRGQSPVTRMLSRSSHVLGLAWDDGPAAAAPRPRAASRGAAARVRGGRARGGRAAGSPGIPVLRVDGRPAGPKGRGCTHVDRELGARLAQLLGRGLGDAAAQGAPTCVGKGVRARCCWCCCRRALTTCAELAPSRRQACSPRASDVEGPEVWMPLFPCRPFVYVYCNHKKPKRRAHPLTQSL